MKDYYQTAFTLKDDWYKTPGTDNLRDKAAPAPNSITLGYWNCAAKQGVSNQSNHIQSVSTRVQLPIPSGHSAASCWGEQSTDWKQKKHLFTPPLLPSVLQTCPSYSPGGTSHTAYLQADLHRSSVFCQTRTSCLCCSWVPGLSSLLLLHISCWEPKETWHMVLLRYSVCYKCVSHTLPYKEHIFNFSCLQSPLDLFLCVGSSYSSLKLW